MSPQILLSVWRYRCPILPIQFLLCFRTRLILPPSSSAHDPAAPLFATPTRPTRPLPRSRLNPDTHVSSPPSSPSPLRTPAPARAVPISFTMETRSRKRSREEAEASGQSQATSASALPAASESEPRKRRRVSRRSNAVSNTRSSQYRTRSVAQRETKLAPTKGRSTRKASRR